MQYTSTCEPCRYIFDWDSPVMTTEDPKCPKCDGPTNRKYHTVAAIWSKPLVDYGDSSKETHAIDQKRGGHVVFERNSDEAIEKGAPIKRRIVTVADQRDYCKREGLVMPSDLPKSLKIGADGQSFETQNRGEV